MCDAHDDEQTWEEREAERRSRAYDGFAGCEAHARSQAESEQICKEQDHVYSGGRCICCGKSR